MAEDAARKSNAWVPAKTAIQTFRDSGYKSTADALAELVDNSIEAESSTIQILSFESEQMVRERRQTRIEKLAVYDNGHGMTEDVLALCLQFGMGTRMKSRTGIGRFGIGLPNASVSQCRRVDVYSWVDGICRHTYLDVDEVTEGQSEERNPVTVVPLPTDYTSEIEGEPGDSGTLIIWSRCDRLDLARTKTLYNRMERHLCRVYRHFLDDDDSYGRQRELLLVTVGGSRVVDRLAANDPLYLTTPNTLPGHESEATNERYGTPVTIEFPYGSDEKETAPVEIHFSIAKPSTQSLGGSSKVGNHYRENTGISVVRAGREIDFGNFGFYNPRDERQRWWGCELRFDPRLDDLFGVTNNKQSCRGFAYFDEEEFKKEHEKDWEVELNSDPRHVLMRNISQHISRNLTEMMNIIKSRGAGSRSGKNAETNVDESTRLANQVVKEIDSKSRSRSEGSNKTRQQKIEEWTAQARTHEELTDEQVESIAKENVDLEIAKEFDGWPGAQFFSTKTIGSTWTVILNQRHPFFTEMYEELLNASDSRYIQALDLLLYGYAQMENELYGRVDDLDEMRESWGKYVRNFLKRLAENA